METCRTELSFFFSPSLPACSPRNHGLHIYFHLGPLLPHTSFYNPVQSFPCHSSFAFWLQSSAGTDPPIPQVHWPWIRSRPRSLFSLNGTTSPVYPRILTSPKHVTLAAEFLSSLYLLSYFLHISKENQVRMGRPINYLDVYCVPHSESRTKGTGTNMTDSDIL